MSTPDSSRSFSGHGSPVGRKSPRRKSPSPYTDDNHYSGTVGPHQAPARTSESAHTASIQDVRLPPSHGPSVTSVEANGAQASTARTSPSARVGSLASDASDAPDSTATASDRGSSSSGLGCWFHSPAPSLPSVGGGEGEVKLPVRVASSNPRRSLNLAFSVSPRTGSESDVLAHTGTPQLLQVLQVDKASPPESFVCDLACLEERRLFVTVQCVQLAKKMSTARIIDGLVPALLSAFEYDDYSESFDNCVPSIASALPDIVAELEDKSVETMTYFVGLLMQLCCAAEISVTRVITASMQRIIELVDESALVELFAPLVLSMRRSFWVSPRAVAAGLLGVLAAHPKVVEASKMTVSNWFSMFIECSTDTCMRVREAAVRSLHQWVTVANVHRLNWVEMPLPLVKGFVTDDLSDTVRYQLVREMLPLADRMGVDATSKYLQSSFIAACSDASWRVRFVAAENIGAFASRVAHPEALVRMLMLLAEDEEPEIRSAIASQLDMIAGLLTPEVVSRCCLTVALRLAEDPIAAVRSHVVSSCYAFVSPYNSTTTCCVCDVAVQLMADPELMVQVAAIDSLKNIMCALSPKRGTKSRHLGSSRDSERTPARHSLPPSGSSSAKTSPAASPSLQVSSAPCVSVPSDGSRCSSPNVLASSQSDRGGQPIAEGKHVSYTSRIISMLIGRLRELSVASNWRLRNAVVHALRYFPDVLTVEQFAPLTQILRTLLRDPVSQVRAHAVDTLVAVARAFGAEWAAQMTVGLLHSEFAPAQQVAYVWRIIAVQCLAVLLPVAADLPTGDLRRQQLLGVTTELLQQYACDMVPNVCITVAKAMSGWRQWFSASSRERAVYNDCVRRLQGHADRDVVAASSGVALLSEGPAVENGPDGEWIGESSSVPF